ncbi:hypothetical protein MKZ38_001614 [Zalerion maritima]|uniref:Integrase zinc-binding domain-containing protein n=1 Tax=Zalerion maritima TaxID=339359 RepID=A0AAD5RFF9_9PEZI|nr:hypothetical protein MKZ38_001614 [Zalerion maritima]
MSIKTVPNLDPGDGKSHDSTRKLCHDTVIFTVVIGSDHGRGHVGGLHLWSRYASGQDTPLVKTRLWSRNAFGQDAPLVKSLRLDDSTGTMSSVNTHSHVTFTQSTKASFDEHIKDQPNNHRISSTEKENILSWLGNSRHPASQKEFNRRNYVQKTFSWDESTQTLVAATKSNKVKNRIVVTEDMILQTVEQVHVESHHAGWDATWKILRAAYYGILRSDMIYLLKRCEVCSRNPTRRPKCSPATAVRPTELPKGGNISMEEAWECELDLGGVESNKDHSEFFAPLRDYFDGQDLLA